jgi:rhodanese-related sulfurtransferase
VWGAIPLIIILVVLAGFVGPRTIQQVPLQKDGNSMVGEIRPQDLKARLDKGEQPVLLDVREPEEVAIVRLPGAVHIPMGEVPGRLHELDPDKEIIVYCHHGVRSLRVAQFLAQRDFNHVVNLSGGINAWALDVEPGMARY